jgi:hypothetical protein
MMMTISAKFFVLSGEVKISKHGFKNEGLPQHFPVEFSVLL